MKNNLKLLTSSIILFALSVLCILSVPAWSTPIPPPVAVLKISPDPAVVGQTVLLNGSYSVAGSGSIVKYEWDFTNNGSYDYYETPTYYPDKVWDGKTTHVYCDANTYTAKLRVKNSYNYYDTDTDTVVIEPVQLVVYTYDAVGNRTSMTDSSGTTSYSYDYPGRLISVTNPDQKTISYQYDASGNRTQLTDPNGNITIYTYDDNNRLTDVNAPAGSTAYQYDSLGILTGADYPNGTYTQYFYDPNRNWLCSLVNKEPNDAVLSSYNYTYDSAGNRLSVTEDDGSAVSYGYDDIYQLTSETRTGTNAYGITYQYDNAGNRTQMVKNSVTTTYTYNINNQLLTETSADANMIYVYDDNGNLVSKTDANDANNTTVYTWDWANHLLSVSEPNGNTAYEYDGDGTRISKTQSGAKTKYINDTAMGLVQVLLETNNAGTVQAVYTYGNDLIAMNRADANSYYHYDGLGSSRQLTGDSGTVDANYTYDGFGNLIASSGTTANPYGFTGEQQFGEADDLVFLRARYYDPHIGRFISKDPILEQMRVGNNFVWFLPYLIENPQDLYSYVYVANNPVNRIDPSGKVTGWGCAVFAGVVIGINAACNTACEQMCGDSDSISNCRDKCWSELLHFRNTMLRRGHLSSILFWGSAVACGFI